MQETGLPMISINTSRGDAAQGQFGLATLPGHRGDARVAIDHAIDYAHTLGAGAIHVMCGIAQGPDARACFVENLQYACTIAQGKTILIEPINPHDAPGYFLHNPDQAMDIMAAVGHPNLKLMFDCYHMGRSGGDVRAQLTALMPHIGHIQCASVPDRGTPDHGDVNYADVFAHITALGWDRPVGAEYKPTTDTDLTLGWMTPKHG